MRISCIGGGPAGLYLGILLRKKKPDWQIEILERNAPGQTFGWGVVFSDETLGYLEDADRERSSRIGTRSVRTTRAAGAAQAATVFRVLHAKTSFKFSKTVRSLWASRLSTTQKSMTSANCAKTATFSSLQTA
jgi:2-polyprenyl-6-methoxyphenol hydroxylase-like FAD-dependent oxidoreductase